jgi:hypothetical protein
MADCAMLSGGISMLNHRLICGKLLACSQNSRHLDYNLQTIVSVLLGLDLPAFIALIILLAAYLNASFFKS